jgi:dsRNA-specific ribonuclease
VPTGEGKSRRVAEQEAARRMLAALQSLKQFDRRARPRTPTPT